MTVPSRTLHPLARPVVLAAALLLACSSPEGPQVPVEATIEEQVARAPHDAALQTRLGGVRLRLGKTRSAERAFRRALELERSLPEAALGLAQALGAEGSWGAALEVLEEQSRLGPSIEIEHALARLLASAPDAEVRDPAAALKYARSLMERSAPPAHVAAMAMVAAANGHHAQAVALQRRALAEAEETNRLDLIRDFLPELRNYAQGGRAESPWSPATFSPVRLDPLDDGRPIPELLSELAAEADADRNPYLNSRRAAALTEKLAAAPESMRPSLEFERAWERLRAGRTREALDTVAALVRTYESNGAPDDDPELLKLRELYAYAFLRLGEQDNCWRHVGANACLLPLQEDAIHSRREGSEGAIEQLERLLDVRPDDAGYRWLLNVAWMTLGGWPQEVPARRRIPAEVFASDFDLGRFPNVAASVGLDADGLAGGVCLDDFDGDGRLDVVVSSWGLGDPLRLFRNRADGSFEEAHDAGFEDQLGGLNLIHADYDSDGDNDLFVLRGAWLSSEGRHPNSLLRNDGAGRFTDVTREAGVLRRAPTQTAAWVDFDLDGRLDLFVGNESTPGEPHLSELHRNLGDGTFEDVSESVGLGNLGFVKGASWGDYDGDGWPDLFLSRYMQPNRLLRNASDGRGGRRFVDVTTIAGVAGPRASFPAWFWDYDNDGRLDLFVASFADFWGDSLAQVANDYLGESSGERAALYRNRGDGTFVDVAPQVGLDDVLLAMGANYGDLDNDGRLDLYVGTGQPSLNVLVPNRLYRNGERGFQDVTSSAGLGHLQKGHGIAFGDVDDDGDQDVYAVMGGAFEGDIFANALFLNPGHGNRWITLRLEGTTANRGGIGARLRVEVDTPAGPRAIYALVGSGGSFGASSLRQEIGLGDAVSVRAVEVQWPVEPRTVDRFEGLRLDRSYVLREGGEARDATLPGIDGFGG